MADNKTKKAFIVKDFRDEGLERNYTASTPGKADTLVDIEEGSFTNYAAAGLVREPSADDKKAARAT